MWFYLEKALVPINLAFIYPQWNIEPGNPLWVAAAFGYCRSDRFFDLEKKLAPSPLGSSSSICLVVFLWLTSPGHGLTDVGYMRHSLVADHYEHIAMISIVALAAAALYAASAKLRTPLVLQSIAVGAGIVVLLFVYLTWQQSSIYTDAMVLYQDTVKKNPESWLVQSNFGLELSRRGKLDEAIPHFQEALRLNPICAAAHFHWGNALVDLNRTPRR